MQHDMLDFEESLAISGSGGGDSLAPMGYIATDEVYVNGEDVE